MPAAIRQCKLNAFGYNLLHAKSPEKRIKNITNTLRNVTHPRENS